MNEDDWDKDIDARDDLTAEEKEGAKFWGKECLEAMQEVAKDAAGMSLEEAALLGWRSGYIYHTLLSECPPDDEDD